MLYLGIDQHAKQLTISLRNEDGEAILRRQVNTSSTRKRVSTRRLECVRLARLRVELVSLRGHTNRSRPSANCKASMRASTSASVL